MIQCYSLKRKNTKNANIVFVSIALLPPLVAAFNSAGFSNCLRASNMRLQRSEKQHLFLCSFKIFWKSVFEFKNHSERHGKTPWQTARSCRKHATTTVSALRIASSTVAVAEFNLLGSVFVERRVDVFLGFFSGVCLLFGGELAILSLVIPGRSKDINLWKSLGNRMEIFHCASFKHRISMLNFIKDVPASRWHPFFLNDASLLDDDRPFHNIREK